MIDSFLIVHQIKLLIKCLLLIADCPITVTPAEIVVRFGDPVSFKCSTSDTEAFGMAWSGNFGSTAVGDPPSITWSVQKLEDWDLGLLCQVIWPDNQCEKGPAITLYREYKSRWYCTFPSAV